MKMPAPIRQRGGIGLLDWLDEFYWAWRASRPLRSETCELHEGADGTQILPRNAAAGKGGGTVYDFTVTTSARTATLGFGNVTGDGIGLKAGVNPYPEEFLAGNTPPFTDTKETPDGEWSAYLIVTVETGDSSAISSISWDIDASTPDDDPDHFTYYFHLTSGSTTDGKASVLNKTGRGSQKFGLCGTVGYWAPAGPGI